MPTYAATGTTAAGKTATAAAQAELRGNGPNLLARYCKPVRRLWAAAGLFDTMSYGRLPHRARRCRPRLGGATSRARLRRCLQARLGR